MSKHISGSKTLRSVRLTFLANGSFVRKKKLRYWHNSRQRKIKLRNISYLSGHLVTPKAARPSIVNWFVHMDCDTMGRLKHFKDTDGAIYHFSAILPFALIYECSL